MPKKSTDGWVRIFDIPKTTVHPNGFTVYKIVSFIYHKSLPDLVTKYVTWKRFNQLKEFHAYITRRNKELFIKDIVPSLTTTLNYFKRMDKHVIEARRQHFINIFEYVSKYPILMSNDAFAMFFNESQLQVSEIDFDQTEISQLDINYPDNLSDNHDTILNQNSSKDLKIQEKVDILNDAENGNKILEKILKDCEVYFVKALNDEVDGKFIEAFTNYKSGIACLLNGLKNNDVLLQKNTYQHSFISNKAQRYIEHAENLFKTHLKDNDTVNDNYCFQNALISDLNLHQYKIVNIIDSVLLAENTATHNQFIIKVSQKYTDISNVLILPQNVPFMVKLIEIYETENAYFFFLQYLKYKFLSKVSMYPWLSYSNGYVYIQKSLKFDRYASQKGLFWNYLNEKCNWQKDNEKILSNVNKPDLNMNNEITVQVAQEAFEMSKQTGIDDILKKSSNLLQSVNTTLEKSRSLTVSSSAAVIEQIIQTDELSITNQLIRKWTAQLLCALQHLHKSGIIYKNLQPRKLLIDDEDNLTLVFKHQFRDKVSLRETGSATRSMYEAPEIRECDPITPAADLWSFGVIFYEMLTGKKLDFENFQQLFENTNESSDDDDKISIATEMVSNQSISFESQSLLERLLVRKPKNRITIDEIKRHEFYTDFDWNSLQ